MFTTIDTEKRHRAEAQLDLIKSYLEARHQTTINIAITSIAVISLTNLIKLNSEVKIGIIALLLLNLVIFWYDVIIMKKSLNNALTQLNQIMGERVAKQLEDINSKIGWVTKHFTEIATALFTLIVLYFIYLLLK